MKTDLKVKSNAGALTIEPHELVEAYAAALYRHRMKLHDLEALVLAQRAKLEDETLAELEGLRSAD
jgi:hypothetical protein